MRHLLMIWQLPQFLLGIIFLLVLRARIIRVIEYRGSCVFFVEGFKGGISLSRFIYLDSSYVNDESSLRHEYGHTIQSRLLGWFYLAVVGLPSIIRASIWNRLNLDSDSYHSGYPEHWADRLGGA